MQFKKNFNAIIKEGPENVQLINTNNGSIKWGNVLMLIDEALLSNLKKKVKFIENGKFDETNGEPTIKVIGSLTASNVMKVKKKTNSDIDYPYFTKDIANDIGITNYQTQTLIHHFHLIGDPRFNQTVTISSKTRIPKYSKLAYDFLKDELEKVHDRECFFELLSREFQNRKK